MVKIPAVIDSACLIGLERIGRLDLLPALINPVMVPPAVASEFGSTPAWMIVKTPEGTGMVAALRLVVDPGESEAIALAFETGCRILLDDRKAREAAHRLGIPVTGTIGLLLKAKEAGVVASIRPLLDALDANQFRIGESLRTAALRLADEK